MRAELGGVGDCWREIRRRRVGAPPRPPSVSSRRGRAGLLGGGSIPAAVGGRRSAPQRRGEGRPRPLHLPPRRSDAAGLRCAALPANVCPLLLFFSSRTARLSPLWALPRARIMPDQITVSEFIAETTEDYNSPTTSSFTTRLQNCRNTVTLLEEVRSALFVPFSLR